MRRHSNAFDLIRLVAAGMVLWSHQHALMGLPEPGVAALRVSFGGLGVLIFFVVSGYLNTLSAVRHHSVREFLISRALRIYPALVVCVALTVLLGALVAPDLKTYLDYKLLSFIGKDITLLNGAMAGVSHVVFAGTAMPNALNGSLWTLPYEVRMYVILAICFALFQYKPAMAFVVSAAGLLALGFTALDGFWLQFSAMFLAGSFVAAAQRLKYLTLGIAAILALAGLFAVIGRELFALYLLLAVAAIGLGSVKLPAWLRPPLDLSYAVYLYAFPVQQVSAMLTKSFWLGLLFSGTVTFALALLSALLVEQPAQKLKLVLQQRRSAAPVRALTAAIGSAEPSRAEAI